QPITILSDEKNDSQRSAVVEDVPASDSDATSAESLWPNPDGALTDITGTTADSLFTDSQLSSAADIITQNAIPSLQYGDLAHLGLIGWSPVGLVRWSLEV